MRIAFLCVSVAAVAGSAGASTVVYSSDFNSPLGGEWTGVSSTESVQGLNGLGNTGRTFSGSLLRNDSTGNPASVSRLTLNGLAAHSTISVGLLLAVIDSWDGLGQQGFGPDYFNITLDGVSIFQASFASALGTGSYTAPANGLIAGSGQFGGAGAADFGWNGTWNDSAFDLYLESALQNIAHTSSTAVFEFFASGAGWQGGFDESWGIDNIEVSIDGTVVPMPAASVLGAAGLLAAGARRRRR